MTEKEITEAEVEKKITEVERKIEEAEEKKERELLARDTRNILLGSFMSIFSSITTLFIVQKYLIPKTAAAAIAEYREKEEVMSNIYTNNSLSIWKPLSEQEFEQIRNITDN